MAKSASRAKRNPENPANPDSDKDAGLAKRVNHPKPSAAPPALRLLPNHQIARPVHARGEAGRYQRGRVGLLDYRWGRRDHARRQVFSAVDWGFAPALAWREDDAPAPRQRGRLGVPGSASVPHALTLSHKWLAGAASCQNQDLRDYRIFRILPARVFKRQALIRVCLGGIFGYGEKRKPGEAKS